MDKRLRPTVGTYDGVVVGGGMAGLTAAARASGSGARVLVLEKDALVGGNARTSGGYVWTAASLETFNALAPAADAGLQQAVVEEFPHVLDWMRGIGVVIGDRVAVSEGVGHKIDIVDYLDRCRDLVLSGGGTVVERAHVQHLLRSTDGSVTGVAYAVEDERRTVTAPWTLLATGGYQASSSLVDRFLGSRIATLPLRSIGTCTGGGLTLALEAGAGYASASDSFYGHLVGKGADLTNVQSLRSLSLFHSDHCLLLDRGGNRFVDESRHDYVNAQAVARHCPEATALLVWDARVQHEVVLAPWPPGTPGEDRHAQSQRAGARCHIAADLSQLSYWADAQGFDGERSVATLRRYNEACGVDSPNGADLANVPRSANRRPMDSSPYYAMVVQAAITAPFGGVRTNPCGHAVGMDGSEIAGLFVAGVDVGNVMGDGYVGGLAQAASQSFRCLRTLGLLQYQCTLDRP